MIRLFLVSVLSLISLPNQCRCVLLEKTLPPENCHVWNPVKLSELQKSNPTFKYQERLHDIPNFTCIFDKLGFDKSSDDCLKESSYYGLLKKGNYLR